MSSHLILNGFVICEIIYTTNSNVKDLISLPKTKVFAEYVLMTGKSMTTFNNSLAFMRGLEILESRFSNEITLKVNALNSFAEKNPKEHLEARKIVRSYDKK